MTRRIGKISELLAIFFILAAMSGCGKNTNDKAISRAVLKIPSIKQPPAPLLYEKSPFNTFRDILSVTDEEIAAIEELQKEYPISGDKSFSYGMILSTEAFIKDNGEAGGYAALFCDWLTGFFGIPFKLEIFHPNELLIKLGAGEVDFSGNIMPTPERSKLYFMTETIAERQFIRIRLAGGRSFDQISKERMLRYAFIYNSPTEATISSVTEPGTYEPVWVNNFVDAYNVLENGTADAFIAASISEASFIEHDNIIVENYFPLVFNPVSMATVHPEFEPVISVVNKALRNGIRSYLNYLYNQGYQDYMMHKLSMWLSDEERAYIKSHPVVPVVAFNTNYPISFYNRRDNEWQGVFFDLMDKVTLLTGMSFEVAHNENANWSVMNEFFMSGRADLVPEFIWSKEREAAYIWSDVLIMEDHYALISRSEYRNITLNEIPHTKIGLASGTSFTSMFKRWFPNHTDTVEYDNIDLAFKGLQRGEVDLVMSTQRRLMYLTHYQELVGFKANFVFNQSIETRFGFKKEDALLCSIIDKALKLVDVDGISAQWSQKTYDYRAKVAEAQRPLLFSAIILSFVIVALLLFVYFKSRSEGRRLAKLVAEANEANRLKNVAVNSMESILNSIDASIYTTVPDTGELLFVNTFMKKAYNIKNGAAVGKYCYKVLRKDHEKICDFCPCRELDKDPDKTIVWEEYMPELGISFRRSDCYIDWPDGRKVHLQHAIDITELVAARELSEHSNRSKGVFLAQMSHEIRTPMNSIIGFSELALDDDVAPKTRDYLTKILENSEWLLQIINNILDISKIESGKMELENVPFDLRGIFTSCQTMIMPKANEKGLTLHFYAEPPAGKVPLGDPTRLFQVLVNLLSNAVKFTNTGIIKVQSAIKDITDKNVTVYFEVKDTGIGMTSEQIKKIYEPFAQAESGTTRKYGGTGLGLSITKNIVELMGGNLSVESTPGAGSRFSFELTLDTIDAEEEALYEKKMAFNGAEKPAFEGEVLLCEDNVMNQQVMCEHLSRIGLTTVVAENGKIGVDMVANRARTGKKQFDLIFMDMHMHVMDGLEAASKILEMNTGIPMVALTANVMSNDIEIYKKSGMSDCVGKPFTSQELWRCLMKYFKPVYWQTVNEMQHRRMEDDLQQKLVINFVKSNRNVYNEIKEAVSQGDTPLAHRLAHTLKSNAAQVGKTSLQKAAAEIERQLADGSPVVPQQMAVLEAELSAALAELIPQVEQFYRFGKAALAASAAANTAAAASLDSEAVRSLFEKLEPMLEGGDPECLKLIDSLRSVPESEKLIEYMENLDFDTAARTLAELRKRV